MYEYIYMMLLHISLRFLKAMVTLLNQTKCIMILVYIHQYENVKNSLNYKPINQTNEL